MSGEVERGMLRTAEVAAIFDVSPRTVTHWAVKGLLPFQWTVGGHRRFPEAAIRELAAQQPNGGGAPPLRP